MNVQALQHLVQHLNADREMLVEGIRKKTIDLLIRALATTERGETVVPPVATAVR